MSSPWQLLVEVDVRVLSFNHGIGDHGADHRLRRLRRAGEVLEGGLRREVHERPDSRSPMGVQSGVDGPPLRGAVTGAGELG